MPTPKGEPAPSAVHEPEPPMGLTKEPPAARVPTRLGIAPETIEEGWRMAQMMARSELVPKQFRNRPEDILVAIQMGIEIGLPPMQALNSIAVINGRPALWGDGLLALVMAAAAYRDHDEYFEVDGVRVDGVTGEQLKQDTTCAVCTFVRAGKATPVTRRFSIGQAKKAALLGKDGPWQTHPDRMLQMRARAFAARDTFPDVLRGMKTAEELRDLPPEDPVLTVKAVTRKSATPPPPAAAPPTEVVHLGPLGVTDVQPFAGGYTVTLSDGARVDLDDAQDAVDLEVFKDTPHKVRLQCTRVGETLQLQNFTLAE